MTMHAESRIVARWQCAPCEVAGEDPEGPEPVTCWNCGGPVNVTARPTIPISRPTEVQS